MVGFAVRPERAQDFEQIDRVLRNAFGSEEEAALARAIRAGDGYVPELALVATEGDWVVGQVMISDVFLVDGTQRCLPVATLSPLGVDPARQRQGIGSELVRQVTARAEELGEPAVILEGDPDFYHRFGFEHSVPHGILIDLPPWAPPEAAQVLRLSAYRPDLRGRLSFPAAERVRRPS